jgi:small subunit ribosomal protein S21
MFLIACLITRRVNLSIRVERQSNETEEQLLRRFRKKVAFSRMMTEVRRRRWHVSKSEVRRVEKKKMIRRAKRKLAERGSSR